MAPFAVLAIFAALVACAQAQYFAPGPPGVTLTSKPSPAQFLVSPVFNRPYTGDDIPVTYGMQTGTNNIEQVLVVPSSPDGTIYTIKFQTPYPILVAGSVHYSTSYPVQKKSSTKPHFYQVYKGYEGEYTSGAIYFVQIGPLAPKTTYYYTVEAKYSAPRTLNFTTMPALGSPCKIGLIADVGQTSNSSSTFDNVNLGNPDVILFAADLCYADNYGPPCARFNGTDVPSGANRTCGIGGLRWDSWGRLAEKTFAHYPTAFVSGNHELETPPLWNASATPFTAYVNRIPGHIKSPVTANTAPKAPFFYSFNTGYVHIIALSSYEAFTKYTQQYNWLRADLAAINRAITPFVVVFFHNPWYNTDVSHYLEGESMRQDYETFLYQAKVDLVVAGHVHAYERSKPVYQVALNNCGPVYVTVGDGGNDEGVAGPFYNAQDGSPPEYTAVRDYYFGHAELEVKNATYAEFSWYRNIDGRQVGDFFTLTPKYLYCHMHPASVVVHVTIGNGGNDKGFAGPVLRGASHAASACIQIVDEKAAHLALLDDVSSLTVPLPDKLGRLSGLSSAHEDRAVSKIAGMSVQA
eukprot:SM000051S17628  [mRNA]  locus=s51:694600:702026:- [translate_table: standard]